MIQVIRAKIRTINGKAITEARRDYNVTLHTKEDYKEFKADQLRMVKREFNKNAQIFFTYKTKK